MTIRELIEVLMELDDLDMPIGSCNYYGNFGPAVGVTVETAQEEHGNEYKGLKVAIIDLALDMQ